MLDSVQRLIKFGTHNGNIASNYTLYGHRQVRDTECPGNRLFREISTWSHFSTVPTVNTSKKM